MVFSLNMVDYSISSLLLSTWHNLPDTQGYLRLLLNHLDQLRTSKSFGVGGPEDFSDIPEFI